MFATQEGQQQKKGRAAPPEKRQRATSHACQPVLASTQMLQRSLGNSFMQVVTDYPPAQGSLSHSAYTPLVQRACACDGTSDADGECAECRQKRLGIQRSA